MNDYTKEITIRFLKQYGKTPLADFGGGRKATKIWEYKIFPELGITEWEIYDLEGGTKTVDLVKEEVKEKFNTIICIDVLEHVKNPFAVAGNIENALNPGGYALIVAPFIYKRHGKDYFRYTEEGLKILFNNVEVIHEERYVKRVDCEHSAIIIKKNMRQPYLIPYSKEYLDRIRKWASSLSRIRKLRTRVRSYNPKKVLDVGCGHGFLVTALNNYGIETIGIDFSENAATDMPKDKFVLGDATKGLPFSDKEFDVVISTDFFEHLKDEDIDFTYQEMCRVGKNVLAVICFKAEKVSNSHLSVHSLEWWQNRLPGCQIYR